MLASPPMSPRSAASPSVAADPLGWLPVEERDAIALARRDGRTYREVAVLLGVSEDVVKRRIRSGLRRLRAGMERGATVAS